MIAPTSFFADYGCHVRILEEITSLQERGHHVHLCTYHNGREMAGITTHRTIDIPWRKRAIVGSSKHKIYLDAALAGTVLRHARSFRPDIIHAHLHEGALIGSVVGAIFGIPVVFDYQGSLTEEMVDHGFIPAIGFRSRFFRWLERRIDTVPHMIMTSSNAATDYLAQCGTPLHRIQSVDDAVDLKRFDPVSVIDESATFRKSLGIPSISRVVVYLGLLADYQGTPTLIRAADLLLSKRPDTYVVIAGYPGVGRHAKMAASSPHSGRILFPGRIAYDKAPALLGAANVAVAPKRSSTEANGKVLNYMAMGLPTVCTDTPVNRDLLGSLGRYVPPDDPGALAAGLVAALDDPRDLSHALRERVNRDYSWDQRVKLIEDVYRKVINPRLIVSQSSTSPELPSPAIDD